MFYILAKIQKINPFLNFLAFDHFYTFQIDILMLVASMQVDHFFLSLKFLQDQLHEFYLINCMDFVWKLLLGRFFIFEISKNFVNPQAVSLDKPICLILPCFINLFKIIKIFSKSFHFFFLILMLIS